MLAKNRRSKSDILDEASAEAERVSEYPQDTFTAAEGEAVIEEGTVAEGESAIDETAAETSESAIDEVAVAEGKAAINEAFIVESIDGSGGFRTERALWPGCAVLSEYTL